MTRIIIQQESSPDLTRPWPVVIDTDGSIIHGRPDAEWAIGFGPQRSFEVTVFWKDALENPASIVGLVPTFQKGGEMFSVDLKVTSAEPFPADDAAIARLRSREMVMRGALREPIQLADDLGQE